MPEDKNIVDKNLSNPSPTPPSSQQNEEKQLISVAGGVDLEALTTAGLPQKINDIYQVNGETIITTNSKNVLDVLKFLRDHPACRFKALMDLTAIDYPANAKRFTVVYILLSVQHNQRIRVNVPIEDGETVPSCVTIFSSAGWQERETWDLFGIKFSNNPDLRRILTDYGFEGHPLRKDFPLTGHVEVRYDESRKQVVYEPVQLQQDFRSFDNLSPWEGTEYVLPNKLMGDEKAKGHPPSPSEPTKMQKEMKKTGTN